MWVKIPEPKDIVKQELTIDSSKTVAVIGENFAHIADYETDVCSYLIVKTPMRLRGGDVYLGEMGDVQIQIYKYNNPATPELVFERLYPKRPKNESPLNIGAWLEPGRYLLRVSSDYLGINPTNMSNEEHKFLAVTGGAPVQHPTIMPDWQQDLKTTFWYGLYNIAIEVPSKSLYLGVVDDIIPAEYLIKGAFYHKLKSGSFITFLCDGTNLLEK